MEALYVWRKASGLTMSQLQLRVPPAITGKMLPQAQWIRGEKRGTIPHYRNLERYCTALGITLGDLFGVQAVIEDMKNVGELNVQRQWKTVLTAFAKRRKLRGGKLPQCKPGPIQFQQVSE
jgi:hypothetical protein